MTPAVHKLTRQLAESVRVRQGLMQLDRKMTILAADLEAALDEPLKIAPWSPWNGIERS